MHNGALRVLLVEDNPDHAALIERRLIQAKSPGIQVEWVTRMGDALRSIEVTAYDAVLLDLRLPDSNLHETFLRMSAAAPDLPLIALTSLEDSDFAVGLVKQGAQDYIVKSDVSTELLSRAILYSIERKKIQRELAHYAEELERTNRELDQFTRVVSHDLKSPLAVIQLQASALISKTGPHDSAHASALKCIVDTTAQMSALVDDLLRYARMDAESIEFESVDANGLLESVLTDLQPLIECAAATVTFDTLPTLWAVRTRLVQVFQNLITNAIKYRADHPPRIHVSARFRGPDWVFSVADNGVGIAAENQERVFDMFTRLRHDLSGTGVGLAICKRAIESHGGRIWVDSKPGCGATFHFSILAQPKNAAGPKDVPGPGNTTGDAAPSSASPESTASDKPCSAKRSAVR